MKTLYLIASAALTGLAAVSAAAAQTGPVWTVDYDNSSVTFTGTQKGEEFTGSFADFTADIVLDPDSPEGGSIEAVIDMASAGADSSDIEESLPTSDWFSVKKHPQATFVSTGITGGDGGYEAAGTLSIKGIEKEIVLPFTLEVDGDTAVAHGTLDLTRTDYDVGSGAFASGDWVGLSVTVTIDITATRAAG